MGVIPPFLRWAAAAGVVGAAACAPTPRGVAAGHPPRVGAPAVRRDDVEGLGNLGQVDAGLWRSAQPTAEGMRAARSLGIRTVLNLRAGHDDRPLAEGAGLDVVHLPMRQWTVGEADLVAALRVLCDPARRPVLVHCAEGRDRTGVVVAAYRRAVQGWTTREALAEMRAFGAAPWWVHLPILVRRLDVGAMRERLGLPRRPDEEGAGEPAGDAPTAGGRE